METPTSDPALATEAVAARAARTLKRVLVREAPSWTSDEHARLCVAIRRGGVPRDRVPANFRIGNSNAEFGSQTWEDISRYVGRADTGAAAMCCFRFFATMGGRIPKPHALPSLASSSSSSPPSEPVTTAENVTQPPSQLQSTTAPQHKPYLAWEEADNQVDMIVEQKNEDEES